jgi:hypothetical protein
MANPDLTFEERHQVLSVLHELDPSAPRESRRHPRRRTLMEVVIQPVVKGAVAVPQRVILANVARRGLAVLLARPAKVGQRFVTLLEFDDGSATLTLCEVRNSQELASGLHKTGAQFLARIEEATPDTEIPSDWLV